MSLKGFNASQQSLLDAFVYGKERNGDNLFGLPFAVASGSDGRIAVADTTRHGVHLYIPAEKRYLRLSEADKEELKSPVAVIFDDDLRLYVSDSALGKVFIFGRDGVFLSSLNKTDSGFLKRPTGLAYNRHRKLLYVVDTLENRVYAFNSEYNVAFSFGGRGEEKGMFNYPTYIFWSPDGVVYVTDTMNFRIELFDESGAFLGSFGHHGDAPGDIAMPKGVAADRDGIIYVVDSLFDNVQLYNRKGEFLFAVGRFGSEPGEFWMPSGIFIDEGGQLFVCDPYNRRIQVFRITENYDAGNL